MKMGRSSEWMALSMALLLRTITVALSQTSQRCQGIMAYCPEGGADMLTIVTVATGLENTTIQCNPTENIMDGDTFRWFFTSTTISMADRRLELSENMKYMISGQMSQRLTVNSIRLDDEGFYYCRTVRSGSVQNDMMLGACLFPYGEAMFETCSGDHIPQVGCNGTEMLTANVGGQVVFNVALTNNGSAVNCFNQSIQMVTLQKAGSNTPLMECSNISCNSHGNTRVIESRGTPNGFDINITLDNLETMDTGMYTVTADIRRPSNMMRVCIYKNFSLMVEVPTTNPSTDDPGQTTISTTTSSSLSQNTLIAIAIVIVLLVLLIGLGVFVAILFLWTCKNKSKQEKESEYATIDQDSIKKSSNHSIFLRSRDKKKEIAGQGRDALYGNRDSRTDENMNLDETFNSPTGQV